MSTHAGKSLMRISALAGLTVRDAVRSRLLVSLGGILIIGLIGLPLLISGDNTLTGRLQVILNYTLSFAVTMLSIVTLWTACGGVSSEIQDRRLYLVLTKPVHRHELWLGKWLGIVALNALLLTLTGLIIGVMIWHTLRASPESESVRRQAREQFLLARESRLPESPVSAQQALSSAEALVKSGRAPAGMDAVQVATELMKELKSARFVIVPTGTVHFAYHLSTPCTGANDGILNYRIESSRPERNPIPGLWEIQTVGGMAFHLAVTNYPGLPNHLLIPGSVMRGGQSLTLTYQRLDSSSPATLFMAQNGQEPELLIPSGSWAMNLGRGLLMILCRLAFLSALGLTAGCLLSTPVAVFVAFFIMVLLTLSGYVESVATSGVFYIPHEGAALTKTWLDKIILTQFKGLNSLTQPLLRLDPVPLLEEGRRISWLLTAHAVAWLAGLYTAVTAVIGIFLFNRREMG
jgi:ABC-type transport system involved in multi-copper enzyme maturation permease subunit